jgi:hypothetical protein
LLGTWTDEEYSLATTAHGVGYAVERALTFELQAPLYFALLAAWRELNASVWFARLFSLLCATAFFFVVARIGKRVAPEFDSLPFAAIVALNPFVVFAAFEIRLYSLALLVSGLMWLAFDGGYLRQSNNYSRAAFVALAIAGIYVQYFIAFALVGFGAMLAVLGKYRVLRAYVLHAVVVAVAVVPLGFEARSQVGGYTSQAPSVGSLIRFTAVHPALDFLFPYDRTWSVLPHLRDAYIGMVGVCVLSVIFARPRITREVVAYASCAVTVDMLYVALATTLRVGLSDRYFVALFVPVLVLAYALFRSIRLSPTPVASYAVVPSVLLVLLATYSQNRFLAQAGDWQRVAAYLAQRAIIGDVIAIYPPDGIPAFKRQYLKAIPVVGFPRPYPTRQYSVSLVSVNSESEARRAFQVLRHYRRIWFVDDVPCIPSPLDYGCHFVEAVVATDFSPAERAMFYKATVYELIPLPASAAKAKGSR